MFTDRFIKLPSQVYDRKTKELTGKEQIEDSWFKFLPFELASYRPTYYEDDESQEECTEVLLKCGEKYVTCITPSEFEKILNEHPLFL